jgi:hypothetical protein
MLAEEKADVVLVHDSPVAGGYSFLFPKKGSTVVLPFESLGLIVLIRLLYQLHDLFLCSLRHLYQVYTGTIVITQVICTSSGQVAAGFHQPTCHIHYPDPYRLIRTTLNHQRKAMVAGVGLCLYGQ